MKLPLSAHFTACLPANPQAEQFYPCTEAVDGMLWLNDLILFPGEVQHLLLSCLFLVCVAYLFVIYQEGWPENNATPCLGNLLVEETGALFSWLEIPPKGKIIWEDGKEKLERHRWFVVLKKQKMWESTWMWSLSGINSTGSFVHASCLHVLCGWAW